jgi:two-component sensor histidine kinase
MSLPSSSVSSRAVPAERLSAVRVGALYRTAALLERIQRTVKQPWQRAVFAAIALVIAFAVRSAVDPVLPAGFPFLTFFPAVILTTFVAGVQTGIIAGVISAFAAWYFFMPPALSFSFHGGVGVALGFYALVLAIDIALISIMQQAIDRLSREEKRSAALAKQREVLFKELQHRVANNLAMISGLLHLQQRTLQDEKAKQALSQAAGRIQLVGQIQRALHDPQRQSFDLGAHIERLSRDLVEASGIALECRTQCDPIEVPGERAMLIALVAAELVGNALKHGIGPRGGGQLQIGLRRLPDTASAELWVQDNGPGADAAAVEKSGSLGMQIVDSLVRQLGASVVFGNENGMTVRVQFTIDPEQAAALDAAA